MRIMTAAPPATSRPRGAGLLRRTYEAMLGARARQAHGYSNCFLLAQDDATLERLGYDRRALERRSLNPPPF